MEVQTPLKYLKKELQFSITEFRELTTEDVTTLKDWAREEMKAKGISFSG